MPEPNLVIREPVQAAEVFDSIASNGGRRLNLHGMQHMAILYDEVNLALLRISVEPHVAEVRSCVHVTLEHLRDNERLEDVPGNRTVAKLFGGCPPREVTYEPRVHKEDLRSFGKMFVHIRPERLDNPHDVRGLEYREPCLDCFVVDVDCVSDISSVQQLS